MIPFAGIKVDEILLRTIGECELPKISVSGVDLSTDTLHSGSDRHGTG